MALLSLSGINAGSWPEPFNGGTVMEGESILISPQQAFEHAEALSSAGPLYIQLGTDNQTDDLDALLKNAKGVDINFPHFGDGRGFTLAVRLKRDVGFKGEIRASGHVIPDQALFLLRAGFDSADIPDSRIEAFKAALGRYQNFYQTDVRGSLGAGHIRHQKTETKAAS